MQAPQKKKVGRPITYKGDPSSRALSESERCRIKRRVANRESARRVRAKRAETLEELQIKVSELNSDAYAEHHATPGTRVDTCANKVAVMQYTIMLTLCAVQLSRVCEEEILP